MDDGLGVSKVLSLGNRCNLDFADMLAYLGEDPQTGVMVLYLEGLDDPRAFLAVAREIAPRKPVITYKGARSQTISKAAFSHTGSLAGIHDLYEAAFRQARILTVEDSTINDVI